jgi:hypothetical protein
LVPLPKHKLPSALALPPAEKKPVRNLVDYGTMNPAWRFSRLELWDPFGWHTLDEETLRHIRTKLSHYESMTMNEIFVANRKYNHGVPQKDLCAEARERLCKLNLEHIELIYRLRLSGTERVWGIRELNVLNLLWWDPDHLVCPSELKNT